jgi:hypothetical protein
MARAIFGSSQRASQPQLPDPYRGGRGRDTYGPPVTCNGDPLSLEPGTPPGPSAIFRNGQWLSTLTRLTRNFFFSVRSSGRLITSPGRHKAREGRALGRKKSVMTVGSRRRARAAAPGRDRSAGMKGIGGTLPCPRREQGRSVRAQDARLVRCKIVLDLGVLFEPVIGLQMMHEPGNDRLRPDSTERNELAGC